MYLIQQITTDPKQKHTLVLPDGSSLKIIIYYSVLQIGWFISELKYGDFEAYNLRIVNSPNLLHQYKNQIPFGIGCFSIDNREPMLQEDFSSGASKLYILDEDEVEEFAEYLRE